MKLGQTWRDAEARPPALHRRRQRRPTRSCATTRATVELTGGRFSSSRIPADHPLPIGLPRVAEGRARPASRTMTGEPYGADMRLLVNEGDTPTVIFGPGDKRVAHSADEWVSVDEVVACARTLAAWLVRELVA